MQAFMSGELKINGNMALAQKLTGIMKFIKPLQYDFPAKCQLSEMNFSGTLGEIIIMTWQIIAFLVLKKRPPVSFRVLR